MSTRKPAQFYSVIARLLHWLTAILVFGLFFLGLWMVGLSYYSEWYQTAPSLHISFGLLLACILIARLVSRALLKSPPPVSSHSRLERLAAKGAHYLLYFLLLAMIVSGYLLASVEGNSIAVFGLFELPPIQVKSEGFDDLISEVHELIAFALVGLAVLHGLAAIKHHFWDKDETLRRMTF